MKKLVNILLVVFMFHAANFAMSAAPVITSVTPDSGNNDTTTAITINGENFDSTCRVYIITAGSSIAGSEDIPLEFGYLPTDVCLLENYAYITENFGTRERNNLGIFEISDPFNPVFLSNEDINGEGSNQILISGNYAYARGNSYVYILDLTVKNNPKVIDKIGFNVGTYSMPRKGIELSISGNYLYFAHSYPLNASKFFIYDITNPSNYLLTSERIYNKIFSLFALGNYVYTGFYETNNNPNLEKGGLKIIDVSDPVNPNPLEGSSLDMGIFNIVNKVRVSGNYAYVAGTDDVLRIVDISNPANPAIVKEKISLGYQNIYISGDYAYLARNDRGLFVLDISTPANPVIINILNYVYYAYAIYGSGNYIYVVDRGKNDIYTPNSTLKVINKLSSGANCNPVGYIDSTKITALIPGGLMPGNYKIKIHNSSGEESVYNGYISLGNKPPEVSLVSDYDSGKVPLTINYTASASDPDGSISGYDWDLDGDGVYEVINNSNTMSINYNLEGVYEIKVRVTDNDGASARDIKVIHIAPINLVPVVSFGKVELSKGNAPLKVDFEALCDDRDGYIVKYEWDFDGDGNYETTSESSAISHTYNTVGFYNVKVRITDNDGAMVESLPANVTVTPQFKGDINATAPGSENRVDGYDLYILDRAFGSKFGDANWNRLADMNEDSIVDGNDLVIFGPYFGMTNR